ncbi:hypothetical protein A2662_04250 [Candidatus Giovannonibacteria bacterium RIFCSPHIGHO2_01_FULL_45_33]|uniref:Uncharacterized protein n=1 Tax=Candidatus Giovannonibacteria bacterium RIFCSPLOWO2_01_FULL_45_34 TaxID=1798351 RepID=A0A1F5WZ70_9BACT|nr:MAG: hypothetical protein A2662_04250 [Candidatus Giovannonibacteria bacterium RIFCSPHIGHO2_01_FULL_45_33]OGF69442.1 MAG: hypothetical protein A3C73_03865 [Candidatus Giovannonibacteria bacterium RIFCSPHIGHO2_02_FULL_44_11]OGF80942.1 MAG: hypothetical protein A2930_02555 [Candidatus Giovannonibacteria bacterium RIFCSPLOWO2_01_FULL_45_34]
MEKIKLYSHDTEVGEVDSDTFELAKMELKDGKTLLGVVEVLMKNGFTSALAVRIALNARKSNNRSRP